ncbi:MAG: HupE/UreJ family protein [Rhodospirillaceae bacterium]|nr:HupE/UreJ family protein [Rhodospirillaceae bacterium]
MIRTICLMALLLALAGPASAHPDHEASGFLHPFIGIDHLLAMVGVGIWAAFLAVRKPAAALLVPAAFLAMMAAGAAAGFAGIKLPLVEAIILGSVFVFGGLIMAAVRLPAAAAMAVAGLFAFFHGYAHALEASEAGAGVYILGFLAATTLLQAAGLGLGWVALRLLGDLGLRALGGAVLAGGTFVLFAQ